MAVPSDRIVYRLAARADWARAQADGVYRGSADDARDGYIHLSTAAQLKETARKHYRGREGLVLVALDAATLDAGLRWEVSRGGDLFPHLYAALRTAHVLWVREVDLDPEGVPLVEDAL